jgi:flagellar hook protein FlgE
MGGNDMLRSLYSAVSGVKAHQTYLDVTGSNIANVNTTGFKRDVIQFRDMIYQTIKGASAPDNGIPIGGIDPAQVGLGVSVGSIEHVFTQGSVQNTGVPTDMAISGAGFFVVQNGTQQLYTRAGNFALDRDGNLVMQGNGYMVQGYAYSEQADPATGIITRVRDAQLSSINIPIGQKIAAKPTTLAAFRCNLCSTSTPEIADITAKIPGGPNAVARPNTYKSYELKKATFVGGELSNPPTGAQEGDTWFIPGDDDSTFTSENYVYRYDGSNWKMDTNILMYESDIYYGTNVEYSATGTGLEAFDVIAYGLGETGGYYDPQHVGVPADKTRVIDDIGSDEPTNDLTDPSNYYNQPSGNPAGPSFLPDGTLAVPPITRPGQLYINEDDGSIWKANATGTWWEKTTETVQPGTAYAVVNDNGNIYLQDPNETTIPTWVTPPPTDILLGANTPDARLMRYNKDRREFTNLNDTGGLSPMTTKDGADVDSTATQESITAFGKDIIKSHDHETKMTVYDSLGNPYTMITVFRKVMDRPAYPNAAPPTGAEAEWDWYSYYADSSGNQMPQYGQGAGTLVFGDNGTLKRTYYYEPTPAEPNPNATSIPTAPEYNWTIVEKRIGNPDDEPIATGKVVADFNVVGAEGKTLTGGAYASNMITLDFVGDKIDKVLGIEKEPIDGVTQFGTPTTTKGYYQDGYEMGTLENWSVSQTGVINGSYSNGKTLPIANVALAMFANEAGLIKTGETCFASSINSGDPQIDVAMNGGAGSIAGNSLEMSNVDLAEEFVNLIRAQRGFQANTRVVTTSDQVLEELINMKR